MNRTLIKYSILIRYTIKDICLPFSIEGGFYCFERDKLTYPESGIEDILITAKDFLHE